MLAANSTRVTITPVVRVVLRATYSLSCGNVDVRPNTNTKPEDCIQIGKIMCGGFPRGGFHDTEKTHFLIFSLTNKSRRPVLSSS